MQRLQNTIVYTEESNIPLQANDIAVLSWFDYPGLTRIGAPVSYSLLHSLFLTFYKPAMTGFIGDMPLDQRGFIGSFFPVFGDNPLLYPERLALNVFIFDQESKEVSLLGDSFQTERTNVLLHKSGNIYSALSVNIANSGEYPTLQTTFTSDHPLIRMLIRQE